MYDEIALERIREPAHQLRETIDPERLGALADSIAAEGLHQPIGVRGPDADGSYEIIWGHRRYLAVRSLRRPTITCRVFSLDADELLLAVSENLNREQLNPVEEAHAVVAMLARGHARAEIARQFRRSPSWIDQRAALLDLPPDVLDAIRRHGLTLSVARLIADVDHEPYRRQLLYEAVTHGATEASAAVWRQHYLADRDRIVSNTIAVEQILQDRERFRLMYPCDWCEDPTAYEDTRTLRLCKRCNSELLQAKSAAVDQQ